MRRWIIGLLVLAVVSSPVGAFASPDDPLFVLQWGLRTVEAEPAWTASRGRGSVVAVVDTGIDPRHPDLRGRLLEGRDFADDDLDPSDDNGHGTLIAGIVAASTSNGLGVASVAPSAKILPVRVLGEDGTGSSSDVADGILWAVEQGADVINLSLAQQSGPGLLGEGLLRDPAVDRAIGDAAEAGATVVVAAGNNEEGGESKTAYDATDRGVLVVGATTKKDKRAAYSNYGRGLDMTAPGGGSASDASDDGCTERNSIVSVWWNPKSKRSDYGGGCGSSMAVAFVSGAAALLHARGMTNIQVAGRLLATTDDLGPSGHDDDFGRGRLNIRRALGVPREEPQRVKRVATPETARKALAKKRTQTPRREVAGAVAPAAGARRPATERRVASPIVPLDEPSDWPVPLAAGLLLVLITAHSWRWAFFEERALRGSRAGS